MAATEKALPFTDVGSSMKEMNKKSKTQYFHIEDFQKHQPIENGESEVLLPDSESLRKREELSRLPQEQVQDGG